MARTDLAVQTSTISGLEPAYTAANVDGHAVVNRGKEVMHVKNGGAGAVVVTAQTQVTVGGRLVAEDTVTIPAGEERFIGPFNPRVHNVQSGADRGKVYIDFDVITSVTCLALSLGG